MKKSNKLSAASLRNVLIVVLIIAISATCYGFYQAQIWLKDYATTVSRTINNPKSGNVSSEDISSLEQALSARQTSIDKAASFTLSSESYQSQVMTDLNAYASKTNITITGYSSAEAMPNSSTLMGISSKYIKITLQNPIKTKDLLQFLSLIETNIPKIQPTGISLSQASADTVNVEPLTIEVYTE